MGHFMGRHSINIKVRRNYLYEDAFERLSVENGERRANRMLCNAMES